MKKRIIIISIICFIIILVSVGIAFADSRAKNNRKRALEKAASNFLKSSIDLYHVEEGKYPSDLQELKKKLQQNPKDTQLISNLNEVINRELPDLSYYVRESDMQAYKFTYKDSIDASLQTVSEDYINDLQKAN